MQGNFIKKMANFKDICNIWLLLQNQTTIAYLRLIQQNDCKYNLPKVELANAAQFFALLCEDVRKLKDLVHQLVGAPDYTPGVGATWSLINLLSKQSFKFSDNLSIEQLCVVVGHWDLGVVAFWCLKNLSLKQLYYSQIINTSGVVATSSLIKTIILFKF